MREEIVLFIDKDGKIGVEYTRFITQERFSVYWEGFVYGYGQLAGDSIKAFIRAIETWCGEAEHCRSYAIAVNDGVARMAGEKGVSIPDG